MNDRWERLQELFHAAAERPAEERERFLRGETDDTSLVAEVLTLLSSEDEEIGLIEAPSVIGRRIGAYRLVRLLGRGGMGAVYLGARDDDQFTKEVAIKLVHRGADSDFVVQRFRTERQILANLDHANIAHLLDGGTTDDGVVYLVMERIDGEPIDAYCAHHELDPGSRLRLFLTVCDAVQYAHQRGVIHRDLKPGNIMIAAGGVVKLLDFGIAKIVAADELTDRAPRTVTGMLLMTPRYASPEQVLGGEVTAATDVYALGVMLYELLTGVSPYPVASSSPHELARAITDTQPLRPSFAVARGATTAGRPPRLTGRTLRGDLDTILLTALQKSPARRYASVEALADDIRRHLNGLPILARRDAASYRIMKFARRHRAAVASALVIAALLATTAAVIRKRMPTPGATAVVEQIALDRSPEEAAVSPDGRTLAYTSSAATGGVAIWLRSAAGGERTPLLPGSATSYPHALSFSPDGKFLRFLRYDFSAGAIRPTLCRLAVRGGAPQPIVTNVTDAALSRQGTIAIARPKGDDPRDLRLIVGNSLTATLREIGRARSVAHLVWSRDGASLAAATTSPSGGSQITVWRATGGQRAIGPVWNQVSGIAWTLDGTALLLCASRDEGEAAQLWRMALSDGALRRITNDPDSYIGLSVADDGENLVSVQAHDVAGLWIIERDHPQSVHLLLSSITADGDVAATQDGHIAYITDSGGQRDIWEIDEAGGHPRRLTFTAEPEPPLPPPRTGRCWRTTYAGSGPRTSGSSTAAPAARVSSRTAGCVASRRSQPIINGSSTPRTMMGGRCGGPLSTARTPSASERRCGTRASLPAARSSPCSFAAGRGRWPTRRSCAGATRLWWQRSPLRARTGCAGPATRL